MSKLLVIRNDAKEGSGQLRELLDARGFEQQIVPGWEADYAALQPADFAGLIVLGGAQSAYEVDAYPYLVKEMDLIDAFIDSEKPIIGLCLGAQLLATALGGVVCSNDVKELGWHDISINAAGKADPLMQSHPDTGIAFHFHGDVFDTPPECVNLASSELTSSQVFRYRDNVYGFQYHVEVDQPLIEIMCLNNVDYMVSGGVDAQAVVDLGQQRMPEYMQRSAAILNAWIDLLEAES